MTRNVQHPPGVPGSRKIVPASRKIWIGCAFMLLAAATGIGLRTQMRNPLRGLPYYARFAKGAEDRWTAYGGTWEVVNGSMRNDSDDRGAKLLTGSQYWKDYSVEADVQLLGLGDAGLIARASDAELGVDSYSGFYAGLRTMDNSLVLGRVQHGWEEYPPKAIASGVQPFRWYHLKLTVSGCRISAVASSPSSDETTEVAAAIPQCFESGRIGLRSYSSGGTWRNVVVRRLDQNDVSAPATPVLPPPDGAETQRSILASYVRNTALEDEAAKDVFGPAQPINSLRYVSSIHPPAMVVRGVVVLKTPGLYVQDATGGVAVQPVSSPTLKIGDEVEVQGTVEPRGFSSILKNARVRLLWESSPGPPVSVTANQAATGAYDAMFIQVEGFLNRRSLRKDGTLMLDLFNGAQTFRALMNPGRSASHLARLYPGTNLRLRGVSVVDAKYTNNLTPFVLLVRSTEDVEVVAGPPWWSPGTLIPFGIALLVLAAIAYNLYILAKHWRLRAVVDERSRLAHDIHDTLAQSFAGIGFQLQAIRNSMPANVPRLEQQVHLACDLVRHSHEEARRSIASLRPESLQGAGLAAALKDCAERMVQHGSVAVEASNAGGTPAVPLRVKDTLFRIGQEAIANAIRHANAATIKIHVRYDRSSVRLRIEDDGTGFSASESARGFGLIGMRKRADSISAEMRLTSSPGNGTSIEVLAPLPAHLSFIWPRKHIRRQTRSNAERNDPYSYRG